MSARPLIICDVDEVVLAFVAALEGFLDGEGFILKRDSFALTGNILDSATGVAADQPAVTRLLRTFYTTRGHDLPAVPGAAAALKQLSARSDIIFLSNVTEEMTPARRANLDAHSMPYPLQANQGVKGPATSRIARGRKGPVFLVDDSPHNLDSGIKHLAGLTAIRFIADDGYRVHAAPGGYPLVTGDWTETVAFIETAIDG